MGGNLSPKEYRVIILVRRSELPSFWWFQMCSTNFRDAWKMSCFCLDPPSHWGALLSLEVSAMSLHETWPFCECDSNCSLLGRLLPFSLTKYSVFPPMYCSGLCKYRCSTSIKWDMYLIHLLQWTLNLNLS